MNQGDSLLIRLTPEKVAQLLHERGEARGEGHLTEDDLIDYVMGENSSAIDHLTRCDSCRDEADFLLKERDWLRSPEGQAQMEQVRREVLKRRGENPSE